MDVCARAPSGAPPAQCGTPGDAGHRRAAVQTASLTGLAGKAEAVRPVRGRIRINWSFPRWWQRRESPFFCVVTPIFDPALDAARLLTQALIGQSITDWRQVLVSNGPSPAVAAWAASLGDRRVRFLELPAVATPDPVALLLEIGRRREHVLQSIDAHRYLLWDADLQLAGPAVLGYLQDAARERPEATIVARTSWFGLKLPIPPCDQPGTIDLANVCAPRGLARQVSYPTDYDPAIGAANDFRFFRRLLAAGPIYEVATMVGVVSGNASYKRLTEIWQEAHA